MEVQILESIEDNALQESLWEIYQKAFVNDLEIYPHNQMNYTHESFLSAMIDRTETKLVVMDDGKPLGILLIVDVNHPERSPWTNFRVFIHKGGTDKFIYVNAIAVDPEYQKKGVGLLLIERFVDWVTGEKGVEIGGFDTPQEKGYIVDIVKDYFSEKGVTIELIGAQNYYLLRKTVTQA